MRGETNSPVRLFAGATALYLVLPVPTVFSCNTALEKTALEKDWGPCKDHLSKHGRQFNDP
jgi:hypothetical protein